MDNINTINDADTMCHETLYGYDLDPEEVTPEPCHLYTSASDAVLYYYASDRSWHTIDEDTGESAAAFRGRCQTRRRSTGLGCSRARRSTRSPEQVRSPATARTAAGSGRR